MKFVVLPNYAAQIPAESVSEASQAAAFIFGIVSSV